MSGSDNGRVTHLPRGGTRIETRAGPIQIGLPPETIKDSMDLGFKIPTHYVIPKVRFNRKQGINVAEFEFPAYYNYFFLRRRVNLITNPEGERRIRRVFQETLLGPKTYEMRGEFATSVPESQRPDMYKETGYFANNPFEPTEKLKIDTLLEFTLFDGDTAALRDDPGVKIKIEKDEYVVIEDDEEVARVSCVVSLPKLGLPEVKTTFEPPMFGITILGCSHGFDPKGKTTGFVLWINRRGLMVDPPINSGALLRLNGIPSRLIDGLIVTHCHADHDAGTFQKILEESRITVMTTPTILGSFLRKYSAISGIGEDILRRLFVFRPISIGEPIRKQGGELRFFYGLHSIPAIGFEAYYGGKSIVFSGDTLNDPGRIRAMHKDGYLSKGRRDFLLNFPWHHTVIVHEAGPPPIHTPTKTLEDLPDDVKKRLYVVHIAEKNLPENKGLKIAEAGVEHTIRIDVKPPDHAGAIEILDLMGSIELFRDFSIAKAREILQFGRRRRYDAGGIIIKKGDVGDRFFVIASGVASVTAHGEVKNYTTGDYFGETSLVTGKPRNATITAVTDVLVIEFDSYDFLHLVRGTDIIERMRHLAEMRKLRSWAVINSNTVLCDLTSSQKTQLQAILHQRKVEAGDTLWREKEAAREAFMVDDAILMFKGAEQSKLAPFSHGAFIGDINALEHAGPMVNTLVAKESGKVFSVDRRDLLDFFERNPGVQLAFLHTRFVE